MVCEARCHALQLIAVQVKRACISHWRRATPADGGGSGQDATMLHNTVRWNHRFHAQAYAKGNAGIPLGCRFVLPSDHSRERDESAA